MMFMDGLLDQSAAPQQLKKLMLAAVLLFFSCLANSVERDIQRITSDQIKYLIDVNHELSVDDILYDTRTWETNKQLTPSFGFSHYTYWFKFNVPPSDDERILELDYSLLNHVNFYLVSNGKVINSIETGDAHPFQQRPIEHRAFLFPLKSSEHPQLVYLQVRSTSAIQVPLTLWKTHAFNTQDQNKIAINGIYYGIALAMSLFNLFLFIRVKDSVYLFYSMYVVTFALTQMSLAGFSYQYIWPNSPGWNEQSVAVLTPLIIVSACAFITNFLKLKAYYPVWHKVVMSFFWIGLLISFSSLLLDYGTTIRLGAALAIFSSIFILVLSYYVTFKSNYKYAIYFSTAWTLFLFGTVVLAMNKFGVLPRNMFTEFSAQLGSAVEMILLSFALVERLNDAINRRIKAETESFRVSHELMEFQQRQNDMLERQVSERTGELAKALTEVHQLNENLVEISTTDQLTGLRNRRYFDESLETEIKRAQRHHTELSIVLVDLDYFKRVNDTYGHVAGDDGLKAVSDTIKSLLKRPQDIACRYGGEELALILPQTTRSGVLELCETMRAEIERMTITSGDLNFGITASFGVCTVIPDQDTNSQIILEWADTALYQAKENGRNQVYEFSADSN